jgi:hypothetical protein
LIKRKVAVGELCALPGKIISMRMFRRIMIVLVVMALPILMYAQGGSAIDFDGESPYGVTDVPFDDGVGLLVAVGVVYGLLKIRAYKKVQKSTKVLLQN